MIKKLRYLIRDHTWAPWRAVCRAMVAVLLLSAIVFPIEQAFAGTLTTASVSLSDPRPATTGVTYTFAWTPSATASIQCILYTISNSSTSAVVPTGFVSTGAVNGTFTGTNLVTGNWTLNATSNGTLKEVGTASESLLGATNYTTPLTTITNTTTAAGETDYATMSTYTNATCTGSPNDTVIAPFVTTPGVLITANVGPTLTFTVAGLANGTTVKTGVVTQGAGDPCATSTATAISFPVDMVPATNYICGQSLTASTNAQNGYSVTLRGTNAGANFLRGTPSTLQITDQTGTNATPTAFASPTAFGYTSNETTLQSGTTGRFGNNNVWAQVGFSASSEQVAYQSGPASAHVTLIGYQIIFAGTTAANVYTGTVIYTCTATF